MSPISSPPVVPEDFICPITLEVMVHPLMTRTGLHFERCAILNWLKKHNTCPLSRQPISLRDLLPDKALQERIENWRQDNGVPLPCEHEDSKVPCVVQLSKEEQFAHGQRSIVSLLAMEHRRNLSAQQQRRRRRHREHERSTKQRFKFLTKILTRAE